MTASLFSAGGGPYAGYLLSFIILILAAIIVVALRLFVKWRFARNVGPEDWFSVVALVKFHNLRLFDSVLNSQLGLRNCNDSLDEPW